MKLVGLTGFSKSGKSTAAEALKSLGGQEFSFAKHLKDVCSVVFYIDRENFDDQKYKEEPMYYCVVVSKDNLIEILDYFEVPKRFYPEALLKHRGKVLNTPRQVAQYIGTEVLRAIDPNIHLDMAFKLNENSEAKFLICSDIRFENELLSVQREEGLILGISRESVFPKNLDSLHPSEREIPSLLIKSDLIICNETNKEDFEKAVKAAVINYL